MKELKPVGSLAKAAIVMLCIFIFIMAFHLLTSVYEVIELSFYDAEAYLDELLISQGLTALIGLGMLLVYIITAVFFLKWTYRTSKNLHMLAGGAWNCSAGGAVGWYFVPIATLFKPYQAMREIWTKAHKARTPNTKLLPGWWTLWIISTIFGQILLRQTGEVVSDYQMIAVTQIISDLIDIALGFTAIALVSNITHAYEANYEQAPDPVDAQSDYQQNLQGPDAEPA